MYFGGYLGNVRVHFERQKNVHLGGGGAKLTTAPLMYINSIPPPPDCTLLIYNRGGGTYTPRVAWRSLESAEVPKIAH